MNKKNRRLADVAADLDVALTREVKNFIAIGGLLVEARSHLHHGEWYRWLKEHFSLSRQSADRYVGLYKVHLKTPILSELKIRPSLLYQMFLNPPKRRPSPKVIDAIMEEARTKWVGYERALQIEREIRRAENEAAEREGLPWEEPKQPVEPEDFQPELETLPPELPPAPPPLNRRDEFPLRTFAAAIETLKEMMTRSTKKFIAAVAGSPGYAEELEMIANFLNQVATAIKEKNAA